MDLSELKSPIPVQKNCAEDKLQNRQGCKIESGNHTDDKRPVGSTINHDAIHSVKP